MASQSRAQHAVAASFVALAAWAAQNRRKSTGFDARTFGRVYVRALRPQAFQALCESHGSQKLKWEQEGA
jgi:hypothetical protein